MGMSKEIKGSENMQKNNEEKSFSKVRLNWEVRI